MNTLLVLLFIRQIPCHINIFYVKQSVTLSGVTVLIWEL